MRHLYRLRYPSLNYSVRRQTDPLSPKGYPRELEPRRSRRLAGGMEARRTIAPRTMAVNLVLVWLLPALTQVFLAHASAQGTTPVLSAFVLKPTSVTGADTTTATITLSAAAPAGGAAVRLQSSTSFASIPALATVAGGQTSATVTVSTQSVAAPQSVVISATYGQGFRTATLSLNPAGARPKVPQGGTASFRRSETEAPSSGQAWDIYQGARFIANATKPNGWSVTYESSGTVFSLGASTLATVGQNYKVRYTSGGATSSALFDIIPAAGSVFGTPTPGWAEAVIPTDAVPVGGAGPSAADSVDLATGVLENTPGPDMVVRNPYGPDASYGRRYRSARASEGYCSPGLSAGWVDNYDLSIRAEVPGGWSNLRLTYPNGAMEVLTVQSSNARPTGIITAPAGAPYFVSGVAGAGVGRWSSLKITTADESSMTFTPNPKAPDTYLLTRITNLLGQSLVIRYDSDSRLNTVSDGTSNTVLLRFSYDLGGRLASVSDCYGRSVRFTFSRVGPHMCLSSVSQVVGGASGIASLWSYGYLLINGQPFLSTVGVPNPTNPTARITHPIGYDTRGRVSSLVDANGNRRLYAYGSGRTTVTVLDNRGQTVETWSEKFNSLNASVGSVDANNAATFVDYQDGANKYAVTRATNENGQSGTATYDAYGNVLRTVNSRGLVTTFTYDYSAFRMGRLSSVKEGSKRETRFHYYPNGMIQSIDTPNPAGGGWVTTSYTYTPLGNIAAVTSPAPNNSGIPVRTRVGYTFDPLGSYQKAEALGEPVTITDPLGNVTHFRYDSRGNVTAVIDAEGNRTDYLYGTADQLVQVMYPATGQTGGGRARTVCNYLYADGPLKNMQIFDESGGLVRTVSSVLGNEGEALKAKVNALAKESVGLDGQYRTCIFADGKGQKTGFSYDKVGNPTSLTYPGGGTLRNTKFDAAGNLLTHVNGRGIVTALTRATDDSRVTDVKYSDSTPGAHYDYDMYGRVRTVVDQIGTTNYEYNDLDMVTSKTVHYIRISPPVDDLVTGFISYNYYPDGSRSEMTVSLSPTITAYAGYGVDYTYDLAGRMVSFSGSLDPNSEGAAASYTYLKNGWLATQQCGDGTLGGTKTTYSLNARGQLTNLTNANYSGVTTYSAYVIRYNGLGQRIHMDLTVPAQSYTDGGATVHQLYPDASGTVDYWYDDQGRLIREKSVRNNNTFTPPANGFLGDGYHGTYDVSYAWDGADNATTFKGTGSSFNANNQPGGTTFDADGNPVVADTAFDAENRLTANLVPNYAYRREDDDTGTYETVINGSWAAGYSADGIRGWKYQQLPNTIHWGWGYTYYLTDGGQVVAQYVPGSDTTSSYLWGPTGLLYSCSPVNPYSLDGGTGIYLFDPQGSMVQRVSNANNDFQWGTNGIGEPVRVWWSPVRRPYDYWMRDAFGNTLGSAVYNEPRPLEHVGFAGQFGAYTDRETGLVLMGYRYYQPGTGRFLTRDPIGYAGGANLYAYCEGDPVNRMDPEGTQGGGTSWAQRMSRGLYPGFGGSSGPPGYARTAQIWAQQRAASVQRIRGSGPNLPRGWSGGSTSTRLFGENFSKGSTESAWVGSPGLSSLEFGNLAGGHTSDLHVGKTPAVLRTRLALDPRASASSTFYDRGTAETVLNRAMFQFRRRIDAWVKSNPRTNDKMVLNYRGTENIGFGYRRTDPSRHEYTDSKVILRYLGNGRIHVHTAYPTNIPRD